MSRFSRYFFIKSKLNGLVLDLQNGSDDPGTEVIMYDQKDEDRDNQLWYLDFDTCTLRSKLNDMVLEVQYKDNSLVVNPYDDEEPFNQRWCFSHDTIHHTCLPNRVFDIIDGNEDAGAKVGAWTYNGGDNQHWELEYVEPRYFYIVSDMNGKVLDIEGQETDAGARLVTWEKNEGDNQLWWEDFRGMLRSKYNDLVMEDISRDHGRPRSLRTAELEMGKPHQFWIVGRQRIYNRMNPRICVDISDSADEDGAKVIAYDYNGGDNQHWHIEYEDE